ncbi:MAG: 30S ribosomal protein S12 methylthiotransferase RimO [Burkholderiales bacterium]|nr:30S ribosomal protein S12 methylthiotransferase RimO [Burkholderiales bacterium]|tara:strand:+ start:26180 stop:27502 length:1323 start_codon:yes stop_codon:yes gene_type:complete
MQAQNTRSVGFVSLGCPKATVDSERILSSLRADGYQISPSYDSADVVIVNTCGFIDEAIAESLDAIDEALTENGKVIVTGCLGANSSLIKDQFPSVIAVTGPHQTDEVMSAIRTNFPISKNPIFDLTPRHDVRLTPRHYAYLKISEGCNHKCSFCIIPSMRGKLVSRPVGDVLEEATTLVESGVRELLVISQDTSAYGVDKKFQTGFWNGRPVKARLLELSKELGKLGAWIRLHYVYPYPNVDELIPLMSDGLILPYLDIPFQHASHRILKLMKRPASAEDVLSRISAWRSICPDLAIRSTFIVGFPGETESDFQQLLDFLTEANLDRVGCFEYSPVNGATANELIETSVPDDIKNDRKARLMAHQHNISAQRLKSKINTEQTIIIDNTGLDNIAIGRTKYDAPEIDGKVIISGAPQLNAGDIVKATITGSDDHDLFADI